MRADSVELQLHFHPLLHLLDTLRKKRILQTIEKTRYDLKEG
jgi:hypothetical protein